MKDSGLIYLCKYNLHNCQKKKVLLPLDATYNYFIYNIT